MTSKEALNQLYIMADTPELAIGLGDCYDVVEKDLEVLNILKRIDWLVYIEDNKNDWYWHWFIDTKQSMKITEEEAMKIKEWLNE